MELTRKPLFTNNDTCFIVIHYICHIMYCGPVTLCLLNDAIQTTQMNGGHEHFPRELHAGRFLANLDTKYAFKYR
jgi:hypothetical protein